MDYGITWKAALEEALSEMEGFEIADVSADHSRISAETYGMYPGMEAANDMGSTNLGTSNVRGTESVSSQARRSRGQTGERDGSFNSEDKTKGAADKSPQEWIKEYEAKVKAIQTSKEKVSERLITLVRATVQGNADFIKNLEQSGSKPQESVQVTNWTYNHDPKRYLHAKIVRMKQVMDRNIQEIVSQDAKDGIVLAMNKTDLEESIMRQIGAPSSIERYTQLTTWVQTQFRGRKTQVSLSAHDINKYVRQMEDFAKIETQLRGDITNVERAINQMNAKVRNILNSSTVQAQEKGRIMQRVNHMGRVFAMYNNMVYMMYRLHVEFVLNRRAILKRLYAAGNAQKNEEYREQTREDKREQERQKAGDLG